MSISAVFQLTTDSVLASSAHLAALISGQLLAVEPVVTVELVTALGINGCGLALVVDDCTVLAAKDSSIVAAVAREREKSSRPAQWYRCAGCGGCSGAT